MRASARDEQEVARQLLKQKQWEETDSALLRLLKCTMEAAPQLTLQLYIITVQGVQGHIVLGQSLFSYVALLFHLYNAFILYPKSVNLNLRQETTCAFLCIQIFIYLFVYLFVAFIVLAMLVLIGIQGTRHYCFDRFWLNPPIIGLLTEHAMK